MHPGLLLPVSVHVVPSIWNAFSSLFSFWTLLMCHLLKGVFPALSRPEYFYVLQQYPVLSSIVMRQSKSGGTGSVGPIVKLSQFKM